MEGNDAAERRDDLYRAIGRYIVRFSSMVGTMQSLISAVITPPPGRSDEEALLSLMVDGLPAQPIADGYFAMCRHLTTFDTKAKQKIEGCLREQVNLEIRRRNRVAHGLWAFPKTADGATITRVAPSNVREPFHHKNITADELDGYCIEVDALTEVVFDFGMTCCNQWAFLWTEEGFKPPELPSLLEMFTVVEKRVTHRAIDNHPMRTRFE